MHPGGVLMRHIADLAQRVERAGVHVPGLGAHDDRTVTSPQLLAEHVGAHPALVVRGYDSDALAAKAEITQRKLEADVAVRTHHHLDRWRAEEPVALDVPTDGLEDSRTCCGHADEVGHRCTGREANRGAWRQPEQLDEPACGDLLDYSGCR